MKRKGFTGLEFAAIAIVVVLGILLAIPSTRGTIISLAIGPLPCEEAPFDSRCTCPETEYQIRRVDNTVGLMLTTYYCEDPSARFWYVEQGICFDRPVTEREYFSPTFDTLEECNAYRQSL